MYTEMKSNTLKTVILIVHISYTQVLKIHINYIIIKIFHYALLKVF